MLTSKFVKSFCALLASLPVTFPRPAHCAPISDPTSELHTFTYVPSTAPLSSLAVSALQFNGSLPGAMDAPGQLGWFTEPYDGNKPVDLVSFVQYNADAGIVFWAEHTAFEVYMVPVAEKTYAVKLGSPWLETPEGLAGNWTVTKIPGKGKKYGFGWKGDYSSWFVCEGKGDDDGFYGLFFGHRLRGCGKHFVLKAKYQ